MDTTDAPGLGSTWAAGPQALVCIDMQHDFIEPGLGVEAGDIDIVKPRFSAFLRTDLDQVLPREGIEEVVLCGVGLARCIRATAADALSLGYGVTVLSDATATRSQAAKAANLEDLIDLGAVIRTSADLARDEARAR